ncbi:MAG TPA: hypothetical protein VFN97_25305 [Actinospica sp.]|nr:hypothetical protein [Actinospica sp.]
MIAVLLAYGKPPLRGCENKARRAAARVGWLHRRMTLCDLIVYGLVFMVPIAPFAVFGSVFDGSHGMVALTYVIGWIAMTSTTPTSTPRSAAWSGWRSAPGSCCSCA